MQSAAAITLRRIWALLVAVLRRAIQAYSVCIVMVAFVTVPVCIIGACFFSGPGLGDYSFPLPGDLEFQRANGHTRRIAGHSEAVPPDITHIAWDDRHIVCYNGGQASVVGWWIVRVEPLRVLGPLSDQE